VNLNSRKSLKGRFLITATAAIGMLATQAPAQDSGSNAQGAINVPNDVTIFAKNDPNDRRATAIVNGDIITGTDVDQRTALIVASSKVKVSDEDLARLRLQVMRNLIDESIQIQTAKTQELEVKDEEVDQSYARVAQQNFGQNTKALDAYLAKIGSSGNSLKRQIRGEMAWQHLLRRNVNPFVNVSDEEAKEVYDRMQAAKGTQEYHIAEIFLTSTSDSQAAVLENGNKIIEQLKAGASFPALARTYSDASTKVVGGDLGWIRLSTLPTEMATTATTMSPGQLAGPIAIPGGYSIMALVDKRQVLTADPRDALLSLKQISIDFPAGTTEADATKRAGEFASAMKTAKGCGNVDPVAKGLGAQVVENDQVKARDLPAALQEALLALSVGETSPPFGSIKEGVRVLMLCGRDDPKVDGGPSLEEIRSQIEDDRVNKRAQAYLRDLRRDAVIEYN
jgi:peptidyl-prolyl cis-trans isomerase SurA